MNTFTPITSLTLRASAAIPLPRFGTPYRNCDHTALVIPSIRNGRAYLFLNDCDLISHSDWASLSVRPSSP